MKAQFIPSVSRLAAATLIAGGVLMSVSTAPLQARNQMSMAGASNMTTIKFGPRTQRIDRDMKAVLVTLKGLGAKPINTLSVAQARTQPGPPDAVKALLRKRGMSTAPEPVASVVDRTVPGPAGPVRVRVYKPRNAGDGMLPVLVYFHGGGFVIASVTAYDSSARALANAANCMVVAVAYRKGPENKVPAAHEDSYAATQWVMRNARQWGGDPNRVAVGGESAGGNLATNMCIMARARGGRMPIHQLLVYPYVDLSPAAPNAPSARKYAQAAPLNRPTLNWFAKYALPSRRYSYNPMPSPLYANVRGLPSATIVLAQLDPLQSQGTAYANKLGNAGIAVQTRLYPGVTHEFFGMGAVVPKAKAAVAFAAQGLKAAFNR